jgi:hypothetical protein
VLDSMPPRRDSRSGASHSRLMALRRLQRVIEGNAAPLLQGSSRRSRLHAAARQRPHHMYAFGSVSGRLDAGDAECRANRPSHPGRLGHLKALRRGDIAAQDAFDGR